MKLRCVNCSNSFQGRDGTNFCGQTCRDATNIATGRWSFMVKNALAKQDEPSGRKGVYAIGDLKLRCILKGDCWVWPWALQAGKPVTQCMGRTRPLSQVLSMLILGRPSHKGWYWHTTCENEVCCNPGHREYRKGRRLPRNQLATTKAKISAAMRKNSKIPDEACEALKTGILDTQKAHELYGITRQYAQMIKRGVARAPMSFMGVRL